MSGRPVGAFNALIVDDEDQIRLMVQRVLAAEGYEALGVASAREARAALSTMMFELALCDVHMPGESGLDLARHILDAYPQTAVVMVTGLDDPAVARLALEAGAYGYIVKPFTTTELRIQVMNAMLRRQLEIDARAQREDLVDAVRERTEELWKAIGRVTKADTGALRTAEEMMRRLSLAAELRDLETAFHIERMSRYTELLARTSGIDEPRCAEIRLASRLHDTGKIAVPDRILRKRGKFTDDDYAVMKRHAEVGYGLFAGSETPLMNLAGDIAHTHHERWDGNGYPRGLRREEIPVEGRIACIADVFDALMSKRPYKPAFPLGKVVDIMREGRETQFDPALLDSFLESLPAAMEIAAAHPDQPAPR